MSSTRAPIPLAALCALAASLWACPVTPDNPDTRPKGPDGGYLCSYVAPGVKACCNGGAGCGDGLWCNTNGCGCEDIEDPCGGSGDAGVVIGPTPDAGQVPAGVVGLDGGTVDRLWFATTGDTRPGNCDDTTAYPSAAIQQIAKATKLLRVQFLLDLGDHMYVCNGSASEAQVQMGFYTDAMALGPSSWFMTMGNHECGRYSSSGSYSGCFGTSADANYDAYMSALKRPKPYYSFDVQTGAGLARFVVIADDGWNAAQKSWLASTLADADAKARYTIVARHHPMTGTRTGNAEIVAAIEAHKYSLLLTAHDHQYEHGTDHAGRAAVIGLGGASPSLPPGFATVLQGTDGTLQFTLRDASGNPVGSPWVVAPQ